jgi:hypothetical protein
VPLPANVLTALAGLTTLTLLLYASATYKMPLASNATPPGPKKVAVVPKPFANAVLPFPASVLAFQ